MATSGTHSHVMNSVIKGTDVEKEFTRVNVNEAHKAVLTEHTENLNEDIDMKWFI